MEHNYNLTADIAYIIGFLQFLDMWPGSPHPKHSRCSFGSLGFVHILETATEAAPQGGLRHRLSPALLDEFLPHREQVLEDFLSNTACLSLNCQPGDVLPVTDSGEPEHPVDCLGGARQGH